MSAELVNIYNDREYLENELKKKRICRFCLVQTNLTNVFVRELQTTIAPLSVQVMACASIEVYPNDGMPTWICTECRQLFAHSYRFKQMCKNADNLLRQFPTTGKWPKPLEKPKLIQNEIKKPNLTSPSTIVSTTTIGSTTVTRNTLPLIQNAFTISNPTVSKKILNSDPAKSPEPPAPVRIVKIEPLSDDNEKEEKLKINDIKTWIENAGDEKKYKPNTGNQTPKRPKILNKASVRILNREANPTVEPKFSIPQMTLNEDGNVEIVTEILDPMYNADTAGKVKEKIDPVKTNVYPCPHCDRTFPLLQLRDIHIINHNRERRFQCPDCDKSFFSKYDLQKHEVRHTGDKPFKCVVCEKAFSRATLLRRHEKTHTDIPKILCVYCEKAFLSKEELDQHVARHQKNRPFQCRVCQKSFAFKQGLERHEIVHSAVQPYPCQYCEKSFPTPSKLARHLTAHAGKRPYPCKYCNKSYVLSHHLSRHVRSHKHVKTLHACTECHKVFKTRDELIYHSAVHSTATLSCILCHTKFESLNEVSNHIKEHIEGEAHACEFCDMMFLKSEDLSEHSKEVHSKEMEAYDVVSPVSGQKFQIIHSENDLQRNNEEKTSKSIETIMEEYTYENDGVGGEEEFLDDHLDDDDDWAEDDDGDDGEVESDNDNNDDDGDENENDGDVDMENGESTEMQASDKPKIINQIVISSDKESRLFVQLADRQEASSILPTSKSLEVMEKDNTKPTSTKIRKIITLGGRVQSIESHSDETMQSGRRKVALPLEKKTEIKTEKDEKMALNTEKPTLLTLRKNPVEQKQPKKSLPTIQDVITTTTKTTSAESSKNSTNPKKITRQTILPLSANRNASSSTPSTATSKSFTKGKSFIVPKSQAEALAKQGRLKFKEGNMIIVKGSSTNETNVKKGNK